MITLLWIVAVIAAFWFGAWCEFATKRRGMASLRAKLAVEEEAMVIASSTIQHYRDDQSMRIFHSDTLRAERNAYKDAFQKADREREQLKSEVETLRRRVDQLRHDKLSTY